MKANLIEGSVSGHLCQMAGPMVVGILAIIGFNLADTFFVGQIDENSLAAMTYTFPVVMFYGSLALGLGVGASSLVARAIGEGNQGRVKDLTTHSLLLSVIIVTLFVGIGLLTVDPLFKLLGAKSQSLILIRQYMDIWYLGMPFLVVPMVGNSLIRATGDTRFPALIMMIAALVNLVLDPILIFGFWKIPALGLEGAAIATVASRMVTFFASLYFLYFKENMISLKVPQFKELIRNWLEILKIGIPAATNNIIIPISSGFITRFLSREGDEVIAGFGVATRLESFSVIPLLAFSSVIGPFVGQNFGAGKYERVLKGIQFTYLFSFAWIVVVAVSFIFLGEPIGYLFNDNSKVVEVTADYLNIVTWSLCFYGVLINGSASFNALGKPIPATSLTIIRMIIVYIPLALILQYYFDHHGVFWAAGIANCIGGLLCYFWLKTYLKIAIKY